MKVPLLHSDLFQGQVAVGMRLAPLTEDGNGVAGGRVWADVPPLPPAFFSVPLVRMQTDQSQIHFPEVFYSRCSNTRHEACQS